MKNIFRNIIFIFFIQIQLGLAAQPKYLGELSIQINNTSNLISKNKLDVQWKRIKGFDRTILIDEEHFISQKRSKIKDTLTIKMPTINGGYPAIIEIVNNFDTSMMRFILQDVPYDFPVRLILEKFDPGNYFFNINNLRFCTNKDSNNIVLDKNVYEKCKYLDTSTLKSPSSTDFTVKDLSQFEFDISQLDPSFLNQSQHLLLEDYHQFPEEIDEYTIEQNFLRNKTVLHKFSLDKGYTKSSDRAGKVIYLLKGNTFLIRTTVEPFGFPDFTSYGIGVWQYTNYNKTEIKMLTPVHWMQKANTGIYFGLSYFNLKRDVLAPKNNTMYFNIDEKYKKEL